MEFKVALEEAVNELGLQQLKPKQLEAIEAFVIGDKDVFVALPTGYGKSVIYGVLPTLYNKMRVVCISPLTSIMVDQQQKFADKGIKAEFVGEAQTDAAVVDRVLQGDLQLLYISPENLLNNPKFRSMLLTAKYKDNLVALAVDEAHCVKTWGDDFRVAFAHIGDLRSVLPDNVHILALTATATSDVLKVVKTRLVLDDPQVIGISPNRANIKYYIEPLPSITVLCDLMAENLSSLHTAFPKTLIFCRTIADCVQLYQTIRDKMGADFTEPQGYPDYHQFRLVDMYSRSSSDGMKKKVLRSFKTSSSKLRIVIATTAFSMGIDCPDIQHVIHYGPPSSVEQYVQETGRAGRNNADSTALLLFRKPDKHLQPPMIKYSMNKTECRRDVLFRTFLFYKKELVSTKCKCCDICASNCDCVGCL